MYNTITYTYQRLKSLYIPRDGIERRLAWCLGCEVFPTSSHDPSSPDTRDARDAPLPVACGAARRGWSAADCCWRVAQRARGPACSDGTVRTQWGRASAAGGPRSGSGAGTSCAGSSPRGLPTPADTNNNTCRHNTCRQNHNTRRHNHNTCRHNYNTCRHSHTPEITAPADTITAPTDTIIAPADTITTLRATNATPAKTIRIPVAPADTITKPVNTRKTHSDTIKTGADTNTTPATTITSAITIIPTVPTISTPADTQI